MNSLQLKNWSSRWCCSFKIFFIYAFFLVLIQTNLSAQTTIYVDQATGSDSNNGLSASSAVKTIGQGITVLKAQSGDILNVGPGTYYENPSFSSLGSSSSKPIWVLANPRGQATISNMWEDAENGDVTWTSVGSNTWRASRSVDAFVGSYENKFLFHHASLSDLQASSVVTGITKPAYGFAQEGSYMYVRLPSSENPNGQSVKLTGAFAEVIATVTNSPYLIIDGFNIEGGGNCGDGAITVDQNSDHITFRNMTFRYCRRCVQLPDYGVIEWSEYTYPNFYNYVEDLRQLNGDAEGIYDMVKVYFVNSGNAYYEGALAVSYRYYASQHTESRYNYIHEVFDGQLLGDFDNSSAHHNVHNYCYDDNVEMECWKGSTHKGINLEVHDNLMLNAHATVMSHQDATGSNMLGPHYVYRNVFRITDFNHSHPWTVIKNKNGASGLAVYYYHNLIHNMQGENRGWGTTNWLYWDEQNETKITFYNNILTLDNCTNSSDGTDPTFGDNVLINSSDLSYMRANGGLYGGSSENGVAWMDASNLNFGINSGSNCINVGRTLPSGWPDSHTTSGNPDAGPFEYGENPGTDWPRQMASGVYDTDAPDGFDDPVTNEDPTCSITSPSSGATYSSGASVTISASALDTDGSISKVEFYQGSTKLGEDTSSPYSYTWSSPSDGSYSLTAVATDDDAATGTSSAISITVGDVTSTDYDAANASVVSGSIETGNSGYTGDGYANTDNASGNYVEWTNVSASSSGDVTMTVRFANGNTADRTADVLVNGTTQTTLTCAYTGAWSTWDTEDVTIPLNSGTNTIRLTATNSLGLANIDKITIVESSSSGGVITVRAKTVDGKTTGGELQLLLDDVSKTTWTISTETYQDYTYTATESSASIKIAFYDNTGGNSDLQVDYLETNGTTYQAEDQATNTAVWQDGSCGGSYSELMHCAAGRYIDFGTISIGGGSSSNTPPTVSITSPTSGTSYTAPASITINASASDSDGSVSKVEFYQGSTKLGEDTSSPYSYTWSSVAAGSYTLTAKAIDDDDDSTTSSSVSVTVNAVSQILVRAKASGSTGGVISLDLDDVSVETWTLSSTSYQDYTYTTTESSANIKVSFTTSSSSADAQIDYIQTNGTTYQAEDQATNTAVWQNSSCGGSYSEMMQCGGGRYIDFGTITIGPLSKSVAEENDESCETCPSKPESFAVDQNYPNPFNPSTYIRYWIPENGLVVVNIYNVQGVLVKGLVQEEQSAGYYSKIWNATNNNGVKVPSGIYVYSVDFIGDKHYNGTGKMLLIK